MNIVIDIGNTRCKAGVFEDNKLLASAVMPLAELGDYIEQNGPDRIMFCAVRPLPSDLIARWKAVCPTEQLTYQSRIPVKIQYDTPETLGMDRLAAVCGARVIFPKRNVLVVDAGTCITYDFLDQNAVYQGGSISPGIHMRFRAMHEFTGALPLLEFEIQETWPGRNTKASMLSGVQMGVLGEFLEIERTMQALNENIITVFTGGDAHYFEKLLKKEIFADPNLVLIGLNDILQQNAL